VESAFKLALFLMRRSSVAGLNAIPTANRGLEFVSISEMEQPTKHTYPCSAMITAALITEVIVWAPLFITMKCLACAEVENV
jgi:hypothetical protein